MIRKIIEFSVENRVLVILLSVLVLIVSGWAAFHSKLDAVPDLSDVQVLVMTNYPRQSPDVVQEQVTYPLETALISVPNVESVRGESMFEYSLIHVVFKQGTDLYWARSRVLEYLNYAKAALPSDVDPQIGPDATGVGWAYQYVLFPGWYCPDHPKGIWHDPDTDKWYASLGDAPSNRRTALILVRGFEQPGNSPLNGKPLVPSGQNLGQLRAFQDWFMRFELESVQGVSEVAPLGGFVQEYQVLIDPDKLRAYHLSVDQIADAIRNSNNDAGGSVVEISELQYMIRNRGYLKNLQELGQVPIGQGVDGVPILLQDVASLQIAGAQRQGISEWNGLGETVGGIVIVRYGADTYRVVQQVKEKISQISQSLPPGVLVLSGYDRSGLIDRSIHTLSDTLVEEMIVVALVCMIFLLHGRSSLVAIVVIPASMVVSLAILYSLDISANIMSLSGIAIAVGVVVDSAIVMIENAHQHLNEEENRVRHGHHSHPRATVILSAATEVGPSLFFSLLIITISFLPIFILPGESGKMFSPLALTKTFAMAAAAIFSITIVPVLMLYLITPTFFPQRWPRPVQIMVSLLLAAAPALLLYCLCDRSDLFASYRIWIAGAWFVLALLLTLPQRVVHEQHNPVSRALQATFTPFFRAAIKLRWLLIPAALVLCLSIIWPLRHLGTEFTPTLDEGDLEYMPTTYPGISITEARHVLQQTDKIIKSYPEVNTVFGQMGRAETATDDAPINMIDTIVQLQPQSQWPGIHVPRFYENWPSWLQQPFRCSFWPDRRTITQDELMHGWTDDQGIFHAGFDQTLKIPGLPEYWTMPVANRTNMVNTGSKTLLGIRVAGPDLEELGRLSDQITQTLDHVSGTTSAIANQTLGGYYLDIAVNPAAAARYGLKLGDVQNIISMAIGGDQVSTMVLGQQRFPINLRYFRALRDEPDQLKQIPVPTPDGSTIPLGMLADIRYDSGPPEIDSSDAQTINYINLTLWTPDVAGYVQRADQAISEQITLPAGYTYEWIGQYQQIQLANQRLTLAVPLVLLAIVILLFMATGRLARVLGVLLAVPFGLVGAIWALWFLDYQLSVAVWVGIIALAGLCAEMGLVLLLYLDISFTQAHNAGRLRNPHELLHAVYVGTVRRIRPQTMTVAAALVGLTPLLWAQGTGSEIMRHLAAPMIGGLITSFILELLVLPALYYSAMRFKLRHQFKNNPHHPNPSSEISPSSGGAS